MIAVERNLRKLQIREIVRTGKVVNRKAPASVLRGSKKGAVVPPTEKTTGVCVLLFSQKNSIPFFFWPLLN